MSGGLSRMMRVATLLLLLCVQCCKKAGGTSERGLRDTIANVYVISADGSPDLLASTDIAVEEVVLRAEHKGERLSVDLTLSQASVQTLRSFLEQSPGSTVGIAIGGIPLPYRGVFHAERRIELEANWWAPSLKDLIQMFQEKSAWERHY